MDKEKSVTKHISIKSSHYILVGLSVAAGLSWREAIQNILSKAYPLQRDTVIAQVFYAIVITVLLVIVVYLLPDTTETLPKDVRKKIKYNLMEEENKLLRTRLEHMGYTRINRYKHSNCRVCGIGG